MSGPSGSRKRVLPSEVFHPDDSLFAERIHHFLFAEEEPNEEEIDDEDDPQPLFSTANETIMSEMIDGDSDSSNDEHYQPEAESFDSEMNENVLSNSRGCRRRTIGSEQVPRPGQPGTSEADTISTSEPILYSDKTTRQFPNPFRWEAAEPPKCRRISAHNIIRLGRLPGMSYGVRDVGPVPLDIWSLLITNEMVERVVQRTNTMLASEREKKQYDSDKSSYRPSNAEEIKAFMGYLLLTIIYKANRENLRKNYTNKLLGRPIYRAIMACKRFEILLFCIRFDDPQITEERKKINKIAAICDFFELFVKNCQTLYCPGDCVVVDEQLIPYRGKCGFIVYMPKKPGKYGIKIPSLCDAKTGYFLNGYIYCGKGSDGSGLSENEKSYPVPTQSVLQLVTPIVGSNRNVTCDNWFTSVELGNALREKQLTVVGTLKKKREIPPAFLPNKRREPGSCLYGFTENFTLLSYVPPKHRNKAVIFLSSRHHSKQWNKEANMSEINLFYNKTKGMDTLDQRCENYSATKSTPRWPLLVFFRLLNISVINSFILYLCFKNAKDLERFDFIEHIALELIKPHMRKRLDDKTLQNDLRTLITEILQGPSQTYLTQNDRLEKKRKCSLCPYMKNRNTGYMCIKCKKPICLECSRKVCISCIQADE